MNSGISKSGRRRGIQIKKDKKVLTRPLRTLKRDLELGYLKLSECLDKGLEELMGFVRTEMENPIKSRAFKVRYNGFDRLLNLTGEISPDFDLSSYERIYDKITERIFGFQQQESSY